MYVVTGATGNTGSVVAHRLLNQGKEVRVIGRSADRLQQLAARGAEPYVADITDQADLARVFAGAEAVYAMLPPHISSQDVPAEQQHMIEAIAGALEQAKVRHAVSLSSIGADKDSGTGPVVWLHAFEDRLNRVAGLNVLHLRCGYFMENTLSQAGTIAA
ncbi:MAG: NAD(P)H-binding protein, partial [Candidatus Angelobacter sp.]